MTIEEIMFNNTKLNYDTLIKYGFIKQNNSYVFTKLFMNNKFKAYITINNNKVIGKVIDTSFNEEYTNFRHNDNLGSFSIKVKEEYQEILKDIINKCGTKEYFLTPQANRVSNYISKKYQDNPEFLWPKFPSYAIFRNKNNHKWYAIIMEIDKSKITTSKGNTNIINLKINKDYEININKKGIYPSYHMNKKNWLTIILDNTLKDEEIFKLIDNSYTIINEKNK